MQSKVQMNWEILKEQEKEFKLLIPKYVNGTETELFLKGVRQTEYRRGKEDVLKDVKARLKYNYRKCEDCFNTVKKESMKQDFHQRMDELCLIYESIFSVPINEVKEILTASNEDSGKFKGGSQ